MKLVDQLLGMIQVVCPFPTGAYVAVSGPLEQVVELPLTPFGVETAVDFPFFHSQLVDNLW